MEKYIEKNENGAYVFKTAHLYGSVTLGKGTSVWPGAVLRGDCGTIEIGVNSNVQDNATIHMAPDENLKIGDYVSIGHNAVVHLKSIGNNVLIGMGSVLLNGAVVGNDVIIGANSTLTEGTVTGDGELWLGSPARMKRLLTPEEKESVRRNAEEYTELAKGHLEGKYTCTK